MNLTDNEYLSIFDIELNKAKNKFKNLKILVCYKTLLILKGSPNLLSIKEGKDIKYYYRGLYQVILDDGLGDEEEFIFMEVKK